MKKSLKTLSVFVFAGTLFLNLSFDSTGHFKLVQTASARTQGYKLVTAMCPDGKSTYTYCVLGSDTSCSGVSCP